MFNRLKTNGITIFFVLVVILIQIPLIAPFFHAGFFPTHDNIQVVRVFEMSQSLRYGDVPARWSANLLYGHGYPLFSFYAPAVFLIGSGFALVGFNFLVATKLVFIIGFFIGSLGMFFLVKNSAGTLSGFVAAVVFSFIPYRALDVYVRGSLAEFFAYQLFPWILLTNKLFLQNLSKSYELVFALSLALLMLTHSISAFVFGLFIVIFNIFHLVFFEKEKTRLLLGLVKTALLSLGLSAFYWLPLLYEAQYVKLSELTNYPYQKYFITLNQMWDMPWNFGGFIEADPLSLQLGKVLICLSVITLLLNIFIKTKLRKEIFFLGIICILTGFLETNNSAGIWKSFHFLSLIQFPWRYHILITTCGAILSGLLIYLLQSVGFLQKKYIKLSIYLCALVIVGLVSWENTSFFKPKLYAEDLAVSETTTWDDEYLPLWVKEKPKDYAPDKMKIIQGEGIFKSMEWGYIKKSAVIDVSDQSILEVAHVYYPGWEASVNGKVVSIDYTNKTGLMRINLEKGMNDIVFAFKTTWWRSLAEAMSLLSLGYVIWSFVKLFRLTRSKNEN